MCVGSELPHTSGVDAGRANYLSDEAFRYAMERLAESKERGSDLTMLESRLRFNMLSSQPMCFNLFADVRSLVEVGDPRGLDAVRAMFPQVGIETVDGIDVEAVPTPISAYLDDRTGWDAAIWINQGTGLITVETKYTDPLDRAAPKRPNPRRAEVAEELGMFTQQATHHFEMLAIRRSSRIGEPASGPVQPDFDQMGRNLLLTAKYRQEAGLLTAINYVLAPRFDTSAVDEVALARTRLAEPFRGMARHRTLDDVVAAAVPVLGGTTAAEVLQRFARRYLDLGPADAALAK